MKLTYTIITIIIYSLLVGCNATPDNTNEDSISNNSLADIIIEDTKIQVDELEIVDIDENIYSESSTEPNDLMNNLNFIIDILEIDLDSHKLVCNTATLDGYSGKLIVYTEDIENLENLDIDTYVLESLPMISMTNPPSVTAVDIQKATDADVKELEAIREKISNYTECMYDYSNMEPADIIKHANNEYGKWTQWEILKYLDFLDKLGYNEGNEVKLRDNLQNLESEEETDGIIEITYITD